jgi:hypothetical protein
MIVTTSTVVARLNDCLLDQGEHIEVVTSYALVEGGLDEERYFVCLTLSGAATELLPDLKALEQFARGLGALSAWEELADDNGVAARP